MTAPELLAELDTKGVQVTARGDRLVYNAPAGVMDGELRGKLKANKRELLALLTSGGTEGKPAPTNVAPRAPEQATAPLVMGIPDGWTARGWATELRRVATACEGVRADLAAEHRAEAQRIERALVGGGYGVILADPPWRYQFSRSKSRAIERQYPTMELADICALPVQRIAAPDCSLFLWSTAPKLTEALQVMQAWGFEYRESVVWNKLRIGMGYYFRSCHEILLVGTRGNPPPPEHTPASTVAAPRGKHSEKPGVFHEIIERMYPRARRIELFARKARPGWDVWGNEVVCEKQAVDLTP